METIADCKRPAEQTGTKDRIVRRRSVDFPAHHPLALTLGRFTAIYRAMNKLRSAALTTTATAYGGSPAGCAR
jgi:hypothetical protein